MTRTAVPSPTIASAKHTAVPTNGNFTISIDGKKIAISTEIAAVDKLLLDVHNPRLHSELGITAKNGDLTAELVEEKIWKQADTKRLFQKIFHDGGLIEPLFVRHNNVIAEGNRRLVCLRKILFDNTVREANGIGEEDAHKFSSIAIHRIPKGTTEMDIRKLLMEWHVSGKKGWDKPDQTEIVYQMHQGGATVDEIARRMGEEQKKIKNRLEAYEMLIKHRERCPESTPKLQSNLLSHYRAALQSETVRGWLDSDESNHEKLDNWIKSKQFSKVKDTRDKFSQVIKADFVDILDDGKSMDEAIEAIGKGRDSLPRRIDELATRLDKISLKEMIEMKQNASFLKKLQRLKVAVEETEQQLISE